MIKQDFVKGECRHCGGHLEFPAEALGQFMPCPHCGQTVELQARHAIPPAKNRGRLMAWVVILVCVAGGGMAFFGWHPHPAAGIVPPPAPLVAVSNVAKPAEPVIAPTPPAPVETLRPGELETNHFAISGGKMQTTAGSSLVYIVGVVRNLGDHQRFGVKVDYSLFDQGGQLVGHATDYQSEIDPNGEWDFKALVMESKAASARFSGITEQ